MSTNIVEKKDMLKLFSLPPDYDFIALKQAYKRLVLASHPDKSKDIASTPTFLLITSIFKTLYQDLKMRSGQQEFFELKATYETDKNKFTYANPMPTTKQEINPNNKESFDVNLFNELFTKVRLSDVHDDGYSKWLASEKTVKEKTNNTVVNYVEPKPIVLSLGNTQYYELGVGKINDFGNTTGNGLAYTDLRIAHTTDKLVNEEQIKKRKEYETIQQLETDRANMSVVMSDEELRAYIKQKSKETAYEKKRQARIEARDNKIQNIFERNHMLIAQKLQR